MGKILLERQELIVKIADDAAKREAGLQNVRSLEGYDGMYFIFEKSGPVSFWNKNTFLDLDIFWINGDKITDVGYLPKIGSEGIKTLDSPGPVQAVLEVPAGRINSPSRLKGASVSLPGRLK